ncbi:hypothetical protein XM38_019160 [Halomicronema hongdechloris C2206]|uniref:Uncharacterized protein n=1 Tax=Halomicronema hongdechloris C2206 TaxID=1641165 RepID=A0A1Z3HLJ4_9CYAN|nr:hypothetical protein [Halomicronema hongdechloris]ASC70967.1 hypothetical protein XM38_019160 [Halomicronema hongdechloris C2206]
MPSIPAAAMTSVTVQGPLWSAQVQLVELAQPQSHWAFRTLFLNQRQRRGLGVDAIHLPGTLLLLGSVSQVSVDLGGGGSFQWQRSVSPTPPFTPERLRQFLNSGDLSLLLVQAEPGQWPETFPQEATPSFFPDRLTCLTGEIPLPWPQAPQSDAQISQLYRGLSLEIPSQGVDGLQQRPGASRLLSPLSVHSGGLSIYGQVQLPWQTQPLAAVFQLTQRLPSGDIPQLRLTLEPDRILPRRSRRLHRRLGRPRSGPESRLLLTRRAMVPDWVTLAIVDPSVLPQLAWEIPPWGQPPQLYLPPQEITLLLRRSGPGNQATPATSLAQVVPDTVQGSPHCRGHSS